MKQRFDLASTGISGAQRASQRPLEFDPLHGIPGK
jgi:hypothetical protein